MNLRSRFFAALALASACVFSPAAYSLPLTNLQFTGAVFGNPVLLNNAPNVFNLFQNSPATGKMTFSTDTVPINPGDPNDTMYVNTVSGFTFMTDVESAPSIGYTYINIAPTYGYVQFYANVVHDVFSDIFTSNFYIAPGGFELSSFDFLDLGHSLPASGDWLFQRYDFSTQQLTRYSGPIKSFEFSRPVHIVPEPAGYQLLLLGAFVLAVSKYSGRRD
jgi:hypothetical protein